MPRLAARDEPDDVHREVVGHGVRIHEHHAADLRGGVATSVSA